MMIKVISAVSCLPSVWSRSMDPVNLVNLDGFCLNIPGGNVASGQTLWTWDCTWADNQQFIFAEDSWRITAASDPAFCIDAGSTPGIGDMVFLSECNGLDQQKFGYDAADGSIYLAIPGLCLKAEGPAPVTVASCNNSDKSLNNGQHWKVQPVSANHKTDVAIIGSRSMDPVNLVNLDGFCLDIPGGNVASGQTLWTWECNWEGNQQFIFEEDSWRITAASDPSQRFCIDAGSKMGVGDQVYLSECTGLDQQKFGYEAVDGSIYLAIPGNLCLKPEGAWNGAAVTVAFCIPDTPPSNGQHWKVQPVSANHKTDVAIIGSRSMDPVNLVNLDGFCLDIPGGNVASGQTLWTWECNWEGNQQFIFAEDSWRITAASDPSQRFCIDAGRRWGIGDQVYLSQCNGFAQQKFGYDAFLGQIYLVDNDGLCLKAEGAWNSAAVTVASCTSPDTPLTNGQHWKVQAVSDQTHAEWI